MAYEHSPGTKNVDDREGRVHFERCLYRTRRSTTLVRQYWQCVPSAQSKQHTVWRYRTSRSKRVAQHADPMSVPDIA
eukprot:2076101-Rhodomonas_salina.2